MKKRMTNNPLHTAIVRGMALFTPPPRWTNATAVVIAVRTRRDTKTRRKTRTGRTGSAFIRAARENREKEKEKSKRYRRMANRVPSARQACDRATKNGLVLP